MKRWIWILSVTAAIALFAIFAWSRMSSSTPESQPRNVTVAPEGDDDALAAGDNVVVRMPTGGDVAIAGSEVAVTAPVDGYVLAAGAEVSIDAPVGDDVWAAGRNVNVRAAIGDNARLAGATVVLEPEAEVSGDALIRGGTMEVRGPVRGDLTVSGGRAVLGGEVGGNVEARAENLVLAPGAVISGDLVLESPNEPEVPASARIEGELRYEPLGQSAGVGSWLARWAFGFLALLALGAVTTGPAPRWSARVAERVRDRFGASLAVGAAALLLVAVLVPLSAVTLVGVPLAVALLAGYAALVLISGVFVALRLGTWVLGRIRPSAPSGGLAAFTVGALQLSFLASLPWIGWIAWVIVPLVGIGAVVLERVDAKHEPAVAV